MVTYWLAVRLYDRAVKSWWALQHALLGDAPRQGELCPRRWLDVLPQYAPAENDLLEQRVTLRDVLH